jgi:UDP-N-acetylmuramoyl-tripeptide--D-alanyl-D-alanine ligase
VIPITLAEVAAATGGRLDGVADPEVTVTGPVVADSRQVEPGGLFVAVQGERVDGHEFAAAAGQAGAVGVLAQRPVGVPAVVVDDTVAALGDLAKAVLGRLDPRPAVVAVTGSSGKTSTKDLLAQVLARRGPLIAPPGSYNTEIGLPLTVLSADRATRTLVLEMGARGVGHVAYLCQIAPPRVGVVLNVGSAHMGEFGSREAIARAKAELVQAVPEDGTAVLNADDPLVRQMAEHAVAPVLMFGESVHADVRADDVHLDASGRASFTLVTPTGSAPVSLALVGAHQVSNALAAAAAAHALGLAPEPVAAALSAATARSRWRMEVTERADGITVINDSYNANPESMRAALNALVAIGQGRRTWAVLGEMRELGEVSDAEHVALGRTVAQLGVDRMLGVGVAARPIVVGVTAEVGDVGEGSGNTEANWVDDVDAAVQYLRGNAAPGDVILVKASRAAGLEQVAEVLVNEEVTAR